MHYGTRDASEPMICLFEFLFWKCVRVHFCQYIIFRRQLNGPLYSVIFHYFEAQTCGAVFVASTNHEPVDIRSKMCIFGCCWVEIRQETHLGKKLMILIWLTEHSKFNVCFHYKIRTTTENLEYYLDLQGKCYFRIIWKVQRLKIL